MSEEMAKQAVKVLAENLKGDFPAKGMRDIWTELCQCHDDAISKAVEFLCLNSNGFLPSPAKFIERARFESKLIAAKVAKEREQDWDKQKGGATREERDKRHTIFSREQSDKHGRLAIQAIRLMMSPASHEDKLECFKAMDDSYPDIGWGKMGAQAQRDVERVGRILPVRGE